MSISCRQWQAGPVAAAGALVVALTVGPAQAQDKTFTMKITTPTLNAALDIYAKAYGDAVEKDSGGRIKVEVYPASRLGAIPRQIEGVQFGAIQCAVIPPEFFVGVDERFEVLAAPGLVTSAAQGHRVAADPAVQKFYLGLGAEKGLHGVAVAYAEPSEVVAKSAYPPSGRFQGQEDPDFCLRVPVGVVQAARHDAGRHVARRRGGGAPARLARRLGRRRRTAQRPAFL